MIYLDNAATTKIHPDVANAMQPYLAEFHGNPSSIHSWAGSRGALSTMPESRLHNC